MEPPLTPHSTSTHWISTAGTAVTGDLEMATLAVRLGLAQNALLAQHRFVISTIERADHSVASTRDMFVGLALAAALTEETRVMINGSYPKVMQLARDAGAPPELISEYGVFNSGNSPLRPVLDRVRNKLTFHWDPEPVAKSLSEVAQHETVIWSEGKDATAGETVCRIAADVLVNAIYPEAPEAKTLPAAEREEALRARSLEGITELVTTMMIINDLLDHAITGYLLRIGVQAHKKD